MRTYTLQDGTLTPGIAACNPDGVRVQLDHQIEIDSANEPEVTDGVIARASLVKMRGIERYDVHMLAAEPPGESDDAVLVLVQPHFLHFGGGRQFISTLREHRWRVARLLPGMRLKFMDGTLYFEEGVVYYRTWRQAAIDEARRKAAIDGITVRCTQLVISSGASQRPTQHQKSGLNTISDPSLGTTVRVGSPELHEWLPVLGPEADTCRRVVFATLSKIGEFGVPAPDESHAKQIQLFGLTPCEPQEPPEGFLVRCRFPSDFRIVAGDPTFIKPESERDRRETPLAEGGDFLALLREGDALAYSLAEGPLAYVLCARGGKLRIMRFNVWRRADMEARPLHYLHIYNQATLKYMPVLWIGTRVVVQEEDREVTGELLDVVGAALLIRTEWNHLPHPRRIVRAVPLWVTMVGKAARVLPPEEQIAVFRAANWRCQVFRSHVRFDELVRGADWSVLLNPVTVVEIGEYPGTRRPLVLYGAPILNQEHSLLPRVISGWFDTYEEAQASLNKLEGALGTGWQAVIDACRDLPEFRQSFQTLYL